MKCHSSTSAIQDHVKKGTIQDDPEKKINPYWSILSNQQPVIISRYLIEEEEEEEEDEELDGEERCRGAGEKNQKKQSNAIKTLATDLKRVKRFI